MLTLNELRKTDVKGLNKELELARREALNVKLSLKMNQSKKSDTFQKNKKYIAQILTIKKALKA